MHHVRRPRFERLSAGLVTIRVAEDVPSLRLGRCVHELQRSFGEACRREGFGLVHYSVQNDHLHLIVEADSHRHLGRGMKSISARVARAVNRVFGRRGPVLVGRYHLRLLTSPRQIRNALRYVLHNARKHARQRGKARAWRARVDPASSARSFDGWKEGARLGGEALERLRSVVGVTAARSWLLRQGWWRHGLISIGEIPGARSAPA